MCHIRSTSHAYNLNFASVGGSEVTGVKWWQAIDCSSKQCLTFVKCETTGSFWRGYKIFFKRDLRTKWFLCLNLTGPALSHHMYIFTYHGLQKCTLPLLILAIGLCPQLDSGCGLCVLCLSPHFLSALQYPVKTGECSGHYRSRWAIIFCPVGTEKLTTAGIILSYLLIVTQN